MPRHIHTQTHTPQRPKETVRTADPRVPHQRRRPQRVPPPLPTPTAHRSSRDGDEGRSPRRAVPWVVMLMLLLLLWGQARRGGGGGGALVVVVVVVVGLGWGCEAGAGEEEAADARVDAGVEPVNVIGGGGGEVRF